MIKNRTRRRKCRGFWINPDGNIDEIYLDGKLLFTVDYDGDFSVESVRENIRHLLHNYLFVND